MLNDVHILDLDNFHWISLIVGGAVPEPIFNFSTVTYQIKSEALVEDEIIILGGVTSDNNFIGSQVYWILENKTLDQWDMSKTTEANIESVTTELSKAEEKMKSQ